MTYKAIVSRITVHPVEGANTLAQGRCLGFSVAVDKNTLDGTLGVFFPSDGQLSVEFAAANDLVYRGEDEDTGKRLGGYFDGNRRVRSQKFMKGKIVSEGFWVPLSYFNFTGFSGTLSEGDSFDTLNGVAICNKYYTPATLRAMKASAVKSLKSRVQNFPEHVDTPQWKHVSNTVKANSVVFITEKLHGTSGRYGNVPVDITLPWWKRFVNRIITDFFPAKTEYSHVVGSRRVVLGSEKDSNGGFYGSNEFRKNAVKDISLKKDEVLYFELVGYVAPGSPIMTDQDVTKLADKAMIESFGKTMRYSYGCKDGECKLFVYRITQNGRELSWPQVVERCKELRIDHVPELCRFVNSGDFSATVEHFTDGPSVLDASHIREGVVVRTEHEDTGTRFIKNKSVAFGIMEGYLKEKDDTVDLEEAA